MATMIETALNSQSGVNGARAIIKPESALIRRLWHSLYLYDKLHQNENSNVPNWERKSNHPWTQAPTPARHLSAVSRKSNFSFSSSISRDWVSAVALPYFLPPSLWALKVFEDLILWPPPFWGVGGTKGRVKLSICSDKHGSDSFIG